MIEKLSLKHKATKAYTQKHRRVLALNRNSAGFNEKTKELTYTLLSDDANGACITDIDGNRYIDLTMGFGSILFGHNDERIRDAIEQQLSKTWSVGAISPLAGRLAEEICKATKNERVAFFNSGTEAIMVAIRIAKAATKKKYIVFFKGSYHGTYDPLMSLRSHQDSKLAKEIIPGVTQNTLNESFLLDFGTDQSLEFIRKNQDSIAAVLTEPVQSRNPGKQPIEWLKLLREITIKGDIALIFDEVITGFRIDRGGCQSHFDINADIVTYGKIIGGGLPIGIVAGSARFLDATDGGFWKFGDDSAPQVKTTFVAGTFCHHPLAMAAGLKVLEILNSPEEDILGNLNRKTHSFCSRMNSFFQENGFRFSISSFASLFRFNTPGRHSAIYHQLLINDVYIWEGRNCFLSPSHDDGIMEDLENRIRMSCHQLVNKGIITLARRKE